MITVIMVTYNAKAITLKSLSALKKSNNSDMEIIIVDNASNDGVREAIKKKYKDIRIMENKKNLGFGAANNQAMKLAKGQNILLLNPDCIVEPYTVSIMNSKLNEQNCDLIGCKLLNTDGSVQQSFGFFPNLRRISQMMLFIDNLPLVRDIIDSIHVRALSRYNTSHIVDWVTGAFILLKREVWEKTGGFDENFFMYGEEIEWQYRIKKQGFCIMFDPSASATHVLGASSPDRAPAVIGEIEGWKYWFSKYYPGWQETVLRLVVFIGCLFRLVSKPQWSKFYREALVKIWK